MKIISTFLFLVLILCSTTGIHEAQNKDENPDPAKVVFQEWLQLGPYPSLLPAFSDTNKESSLENLLKFDEMDYSMLWPEKNDKTILADGTKAQWNRVEAENGAVTIEETPDTPGVCYLAAYVDVSQWTQAELKVQSPQALRIYFNGRLIKTKHIVSRNTKDNEYKNGLTDSTELAFETGKHLILIKTVFDPDSGSDWRFHVSLQLNQRLGGGVPLITTSPEAKLKLSHILEGPTPAQISISPRGNFAALRYNQSYPLQNTRESWIVLHNLKDNQRLFTIRRGEQISSIQWAPTGKRFSHAAFKENHGTIWVTDMDSGSTVPVLKNITNLGQHSWSANGDFIFYSVTEEGQKDRPDATRILTMADRQQGWRNRSHIYRLHIEGGTRQRLTEGDLTDNLNGNSPDGKTLLISRSVIDLTTRPFSITELHTLDLKTLQTELIWAGPWLNNAQWGPEGNRILLLGGPSLFGDLGRNIVSGMLPNEYDTQAYIYQLDTKKAEPMTRDFDPSIGQAVWSRKDNCLYYIAQDRSFVRLFKQDLTTKKILPIESGVDVIEQFEMAADELLGAYIGSSPLSPQEFYMIDLEDGKYETINRSKDEVLHQVKMGRVEPWSFRNNRGLIIEGRIYYPPEFDPKKKYPLIVHYYGGTTPISRVFGGRYPVNYYASNGYLVYILQPSGAIGYGQQFSALHVNDWGVTVSDDIITGVRKFLSEFPFSDPNRVGCIGASYGGFMTMHLLTETNLFAAAISHAGISSMASYWGEGYWGYLYSAVATANSFPWNRKDIYINQSPLFNADKISTPLLLLHGSADTNVPPGESTQMFTALKLLGREVEYIQFPNQNHHILNLKQRILWTKTILAWFDRWLKHQNAWWDSLYPNNQQ